MDSIFSSSNIKENYTLKENIKHTTSSHTTSSHTTSSHIPSSHTISSHIPSSHYTSYSSKGLPENIVSVTQLDDWGQYIDIETNQLFSNIS